MSPGAADWRAMALATEAKAAEFRKLASLTYLPAVRAHLEAEAARLDPVAVSLRRCADPSAPAADFPPMRPTPKQGRHGHFAGDPEKGNDRHARWRRAVRHRDMKYF